ncbi:MAG: hypothetical protein HDR88_01815 [Bacteroides sp.]|nr:hypothetical protein [Bacteroides sp.]
MKERTNAYASLKQPGIRRQVVSGNFNQTVVVNTTALSLTVISGELLPGVWDYGFRTVPGLIFLLNKKYEYGDSRV